MSTIETEIKATEVVTTTESPAPLTKKEIKANKKEGKEKSKKRRQTHQDLRSHERLYALHYEKEKRRLQPFRGRI